MRHSRTNATSLVVIVASFVRRPRPRGATPARAFRNLPHRLLSAPAPLGRTLPISLLRHYMVSQPVRTRRHIPFAESSSPPASLQLLLLAKVIERWLLGGMRPRGSADELERRRRRAVALVAEGLSLSAVARRVGAAVSAVWNWRETVRRRGLKGLQPKPVPGRPLKLTRPQRRRLPALLLRGARAHGYRTDLWTLPRVAEVIHWTYPGFVDGQGLVFSSSSFASSFSS